jgi:hypothetical protein
MGPEIGFMPASTWLTQIVSFWWRSRCRSQSPSARIRRASMVKCTHQFCAGRLDQVDVPG